MPDLPDYLLKAYDLFKEEFQKHIEFLSSLDLNQASLIEHGEEIRRRFHTIKGGAGFLELPVVVELAREGEQKFETDQFSNELEEDLKRIVSELTRQQKKMD